MIQKVKEIISKQLRLELDTIADDAALMEDLGADSLDLVEMLMAIEDSTGVVISDEEAVSLKTVGDVAAFLEGHAER